MFWLLIDYYSKCTYRRTLNLQVTAFGLVTKLKSSAGGVRGLCFALCSQHGQPVPSTERSHNHGAELTSQQGGTESAASVQSWLHRNLAGGSHSKLTSLQFLAGRNRAGITRRYGCMYCGVGSSKGLLEDLSGSAEGCHFHGSLAYHEGKNGFEWGDGWSLWCD